MITNIITEVSKTNLVEDIEKSIAEITQVVCNPTFDAKYGTPTVADLKSYLTMLTEEIIDSAISEWV